MNTIVGLDVGFGFTKAAGRGREISIPSIVGPAIDIKYHNDLVKTGGGHTYTIDGIDLFAGDFANLQSPSVLSPRARERTGTPVVETLLCVVLHKLGVAGDVKLVTGLPVSWYADKDKLTAQLGGEHDYSVDGEPHQINVTDVAVVPQPFGSFFSAILDVKGRMTNPGLAFSRVAILDVGMHTTDFALADDLRYIEKSSGSIETAMAKAYELIARELQERYNRDMSVHAIDEALRNGATVDVYDQEHDIADLAQSALESVAQVILAKAMTLWGDARDIKRLLVTGGGAYVLGDYIKEQYPHAVTTQEPGLCNARGFRQYGLHKWKGDL